MSRPFVFVLSVPKDGDHGIGIQAGTFEEKLPAAGLRKRKQRPRMHGAQMIRVLGTVRQGQTASLVHFQAKELIVGQLRDFHSFEPAYPRFRTRHDHSTQARRSIASGQR